MRHPGLVVELTVIVSSLRLLSAQRTISHGQLCSNSFTVLRPKRGDCSTFLRCVNGRWRDYKCPAGGVFNPKSGLCSWPELVTTSCRRPTTDTSRTIPVTAACVYPCPEDGRSYMYPKWGKCNDFYVCKDRKLYSSKCTDISPSGTYRYYNSFMFSCDRYLESNNVCWNAGTGR